MLQANHWQGFSTDHVHPALRARRWSEFVSEVLSEMVVEPVGDAPFSASIQRIAMGSYGYAHFDSTPAKALSNASCAGGWGSDDKDCLVMTVADQGAIRLSQQQWSVDLRPGDIAIRDLTKPWESLSQESISLILLKIPFAKVAKFHAQPEQLVGRRLSASEPLVAFASSVIRASRRALESDPDGDWHDCLNDVLDDVLKLMCGRIHPDDLSPSANPHAHPRREAQAFIARNLVNPDLSVREVAEAIGVSPRHLQRLFLAQRMSPRQYILEERLKLAARKLGKCDQQDGARIIDIAFETGFNDASHFSRAFSQRYGCSPRDYRKRAN